MSFTIPAPVPPLPLVRLRLSPLPAKMRRLGALALLSALLLSPFRLSAEAAMTLRTAKLIDRYAESLRQATAKSATAADDSEERTVGVTLSVADTFDVKRLAELGVSVGVCINGVVTARATPAQLAQLAQLDGLLFINADNRARKKLDIATPLVGADVVQQGGGSLTQAYTGKGVVVGIVDWGFDFTHETFYDTLGNLRIARVWNQAGSYKSGKADSITLGFTYGSVYATQSEILQQRCSSNSISHGTHVAGIAAGSGGASKRYRGVAPDAELVLVQLRDGSEAELIDGLSYIFKYAQRAGKPAVVNLSLGSHYGAHDGTSSFDRAIDSLTGSGRIVVGAAGNEGDSKLHASYTFTKSGDVMRTVVGVVEGKSQALAFAPVGQQLSWTVELWDAETHTRLEQASANNFYSTQTGGSLTNKRFNENVTVSGHGYNAYGDKKRGVVDIEVTNSNTKKYAVVLVLSMAQDKLGTVHLWNLGNEEEDDNAAFSVLKNSTYTWVNGNGSYTIGEIGGVAQNIISVGAYNSRIGCSGERYNISSFSSKGPTTDGRAKPDLIAPGCGLTSAVNRCDRESSFGQRNEYLTMSGTSMSSPMVAGAVALLLQKSHALTPDSVRCILQQNATLDAPIASLPQNTRGAGKLNIQQAMERGAAAACMLLSAPRSRWSDSQQAIEFNIIPNPNNGTFAIETEEEAVNLTFSVYNMLGVLLYSSPVQAGGSVELSFLPHGLYVVLLSSGKKAGAKKMMVYR
jgi:subtilisin family serine protease